MKTTDWTDLSVCIYWQLSHYCCTWVHGPRCTKFPVPPPSPGRRQRQMVKEKELHTEWQREWESVCVRRQITNTNNLDYFRVLVNAIRKIVYSSLITCAIFCVIAYSMIASQCRMRSNGIQQYNKHLTSKMQK